MKAQKFWHRWCGEVLETTRRIVEVKPEDSSWPNNTEVHLFWCRKCNKIINAHEVRSSEEN